MNIAPLLRTIACGPFGGVGGMKATLKLNDPPDIELNAGELVYTSNQLEPSHGG